MNKEIIHKLNLKPTGKQIGESARYRITIFLWPGLIRGYKTYLSSADDNGRPLHPGVYSFYIINENGIMEINGRANESFILSVDNGYIKKTMNALLTQPQ